MMNRSQLLHTAVGKKKYKKDVVEGSYTVENLEIETEFDEDEGSVYE